MKYIPKAPINEEAKRYNQNLPGMGGIFNHINSNLYHYAGNNPVKYTDPDGRSVFIDGFSSDEAAALDAINKYSYYQYDINEDGYLYKTDEINTKGSELYSQAIDRCIEDNNSEIIIRFSETAVNYVFGLEVDIKTFGGGATFFNSNEKDPSEIYVFFMKKGLSDNGKWNIPAAQVLMHEIVGHADPIAQGGPRDNENAVKNENNVLDQLNKIKQKREEKEWHTAR